MAGRARGSDAPHRRGQWQPGDLIPGEVELADEFGCARATVNRALQDLADAGLVERKRKAGTRVALNPVRKVTVEVPVVRQDVEGARLCATRSSCWAGAR